MGVNTGRTPPDAGDRQPESGTQGRFAGALRRGALSALVVSDLRAGRRPSPQASADLGLSEVHLYTAVAAEADATGELEHELERAGAANGLRVVQTVIDRWLFALVPGEVKVGWAGVTIARSSRQPLARATAAFAEAEQALRTAQAFDVTGLVDLERLTPLPLVTATTALASAASAARFARLDALGPAGVEVEAAVHALLVHDLSIDDTAATLGVHRNTIRARRTRFQELTGLDIARTTDLVTAWWLLSWRKTARS